MHRIKRYIASTAVALLPFLGAEAAEVWVEAESFSSKGGWVVDQQFIDCMGSSYLMAHGIGNPVEDAVTTIDIPEDGKYTVFVRTFNWTAPWSAKKGPGKFRVKVDGKTLSSTLGDTGTCWEWQQAGEMKLKAGSHTIALHDLTGFNGRCDAIYLTTDSKKWNFPTTGTR